MPLPSNSEQTPAGQAAGSFAPPVIVTRPAADAARWVEQLAQHGIKAEALPLIEIVAVTGPIHQAAVAKSWQQLDDYSALMFVSGNAVEHFFAARPAGCLLQAGRPLRWMTPGPGTARALLAAGVPAPQIDTPPAESSQFDSQALWQLVGQRDWQGRRVLIVRGESPAADADDPKESNSESHSASVAPGRDWLVRRLQSAGAAVDLVSVYERRSPVFTAEQLRRISAASTDGSVWLFSSSEALLNLPRIPDLTWAQARAIATHPRIVEKVRAAGWGVVEESRPALKDIVASIESLNS